MSHKVAVVEDNPDNRMLVQALLEDRYDISEYETGVEAVEAKVTSRKAEFAYQRLHLGRA